MIKKKEYYPWLAEPNPNEKRRVYSKYKIEELIAFRIPYYVGPLVDPNNADKNKEARFSWMVRKKDGEITPWNFDDKVDRAESANNFIERMKSKDTYLLGEDVVPKESMLYQEYEVLNELNNVRINDNGLSDSFEDVKLKQAIYNDLFKKQKIVKITDLQNYLVQNHKYLVKPKISGLADENRFLSSLSTYSDLKIIFGDKVDDRTYFNDFEKMVEYSTVFEDGHVYNQKLDEFTWLTKEEKQKIGKKRYRGWGKLSKKLLTGLRDKNNHTIMDNLWETNRNFMQIQTADEFPKQIAEENERHLKGSVSDAINDMYTSPANKKAIRQVLRVVDDIQKAMGYAPSSISLEFAREDGPSVRTVSRANRMKSIYEKYASEVSEEVMKDLDGVIKDKKGLNDRLYLYFEQQGKDMYSGHPLDFDKVISGQEYDIDHILPQAVIKDDSLDNRVLTTKALNNDVKSKGVPCKMFNGMHSFWKNLYDKGFISRRKFNNLTTNPENIDKYKMKGFVNRQLVETRQIIKLVANVLNDKYQNDDVDIIEVRAELTHDIRKHFKFYKNRNVNDYSGNKDAYMVIVYTGKGYKVIGIPVRYAERLDSLRKNDVDVFNDMLNRLIESKFGKKSKNKQFRIVIDKVLYNQLIQDGNLLFTLGSAAYQHNFRQLFLDKRALEILDKVATPKPTDDDLIMVYDQILERVDKYFELYDNGGCRDKGRELFCKLPVSKRNEKDVTKRDMIYTILDGLHANGKIVSCLEIGKKGPFGQMQKKTGINLSENAKLIYQSPTGLFERVVCLKDL